MPGHKCSECENLVEGRASTCSDKCRARRSRRLAHEREARKQGHLTPGQSVEELDPAERLEVVREVFARELAPHVRDQITDDVLKGISAMAALTPALVESLVKDLGSSDAVARGRAQAIMAKYLFGALGEGQKQGPNLTVNMTGMPSPAAPGRDHGDAVFQDEGRSVANGTPAIPGTAAELCAECGEHPVAEPGAERCDACQEKLRAQIEGRFGIGD